MEYGNCFFYTLDKEDEIVTFDKKEHSQFHFDTDVPYTVEVSPKELIVANFIHYHACESWDVEHHCPDHSIGIKVTDEELAGLLNIKATEVRSIINSLLKKEVIGIVPLPDGTYAYHFVL